MTHRIHSAVDLLDGFLVSFLLCWLMLPLLIRLSPLVGLVDRPNSRKVHRQLIPAIGGLTIVLAMGLTALVYPPLQAVYSQYAPLTIALVVLSITGVVDDRLNSPALVRLLIQLGCATLVTHYGIRLTTLHGLFGLLELPLFFQYVITILILTGMANAFNLIDGIDGLAGSLALANCVLLSLLAFLSGQGVWLSFLFPLAGALLAFLHYNWRPARLFMDDGGSVVLGFLTASLGIVFVEEAYQQSITLAPQVVVLAMASGMIPVIDALRVFGKRIGQGISPFSADQNHMHHWLLKHRFAHSQIATRILGVHLSLAFLSVAASFFLSIFTVLVLQIMVVAGYTGVVQLSYAFLKSYRLVKFSENV